MSATVRSAEPPNHRPPPPPRTPRGEATRRRLLEAAEKLFGSRGYHGTSIVDVTREAGAGHGTFYLYFHGKEEIFRELVRHLSHSLRATLEAATAGLSDRLEIEEAGFRAFLRFAAAHHDLYRIVSDSEFIDPELFRWYYERMAQGWARRLGDAMTAGLVERMDAETLAYCLMGASHFIGMRWVVWDHGEPPERAQDTFVKIMRRALTPSGGATPAPAAATTSPAFEAP